ncbi:hypothetical protein BV330_01593 [Pseudomonas syringae pv. actinidiae]|nr:hypothetical protein BV340_01594 [Pseudomonas syringae pv. actinidiae]OSN22370.1 hypothetical protein BV339_01621 [Pseudomonas syringae pv. actinidiae]OSN27496.1 hypothetical protein BV341_01520 [Pseudomonas syringae pv. actinidiae]OSN36789.1 hypothetical protein BV343_01436 [Pseudomonas syringae pv. actinidiae]OSN38255.1 hypothetical protein BV342_01716 [Pseudomonas syringae pv. actinidiae]
MRVLLPVPGSSRTSPLLQNIDIADKRGVARPPHHPADWASARRAWPADWASARRAWPADWASARRAWEWTCPRRAVSGPKTGHLGCIWCTEAPGLAAGSRQFTDKSAPTKHRHRGQAKRRQAQLPATVMRSIRTEPVRMLLRSSRSLPTATICLNMSRILPAMVTSWTGN